MVHGVATRNVFIVWLRGMKTTLLSLQRVGGGGGEYRPTFLWFTCGILSVTKKVSARRACHVGCKGS